jgi:hypothetical protein
MIKGFFSRLTGNKTIKVKRSPLDVSDFAKDRTIAPSKEEIMAVVEKRFSSDTSGGVYGNPVDEYDKVMSRKRMFFDLRYRCGAKGRCLDGTQPCRFPNCFDCRPVLKSQEVFNERMSFEIGNTEHPIYKRIVAASADDRLEDALSILNDVLREKEITARAPILKFVEDQQKTKGNAAEIVNDERIRKGLTGEEVFTEEKVRFTKTGIPFGVQSIDELIAVTFWKAAILVNLERDKDAVDCLLRLVKLLPKEYKPAGLGCAAAWAILNDIEVLFYKAHCKEYPDLQPTRKDILQKPLLLGSVIEACGTGEVGDYYLDHVVHSMFSKQISSIINGAQNAQMNGDSLEDPIVSPIVRDTVEYLRKDIGGTFWDKYYRLALMPPMPIDPAREKQRLERRNELPETPEYVLDAVGRSMLLHHIAKSFGAVEDKVAPDATVSKSNTVEQEKSLNRMKELLNVVRGYELRQQELAEVAEGTTGSARFKRPGAQYPTGGDSTQGPPK